MFPLSRQSIPLLAAFGLATSAFAGKPKFAIVDVTRAFEAYHVTVLEKENIEKARAALQNDPRFEKIKLLKVELLDLRDDVRDTTRSHDEREQAFREFQIKDRDLRVLQRETSEHIAEQARIIDTAMVKKTRHLLGEVRAAIQKIAQEGGYDYVFETSGRTSSQIPPLIYIRDAVDLTAPVIDALNRTETEKDVATVGAPRR